MKQDRLPFPAETRDERPPTFPPPLTLDGQCTACGCRWDRCQWCGQCGATHGPGYCELHAELKRIAARHELELSA